MRPLSLALLTLALSSQNAAGALALNPESLERSALGGLTCARVLELHAGKTPPPEFSWGRSSWALWPL